MIDKQRIVILNNTNRVNWSRYSMNQISTWREKAGLTQSQLAERCGWSGKQSRISNYEIGLRTPSIAECRIIVAAIRSAGADCSLDDVFPPEQTMKAG